MRKTWIAFISVLILSLIAAFMEKTTHHTTLGASAVGHHAVQESPRVGFHAPAFQLPAIDGKTYSLTEATGKPVMINFWASWCGPCKMEAPELAKLAQKYDGKIQVYAVNLTDSDSVKAAAAFVDRYQFKFPVLLDKAGIASTLYQVQAIPTSFFINKQGIIVDQVIGLADAKTLADKFKKLVAER